MPPEHGGRETFAAKGDPASLQVGAAAARAVLFEPGCRDTVCPGQLDDGVSGLLESLSDVLTCIADHDAPVFTPFDRGSWHAEAGHNLWTDGDQAHSSEPLRGGERLREAVVAAGHTEEARADERVS